MGWLEARLIRAASNAKRITLANVQNPDDPVLPKAELATVSEFFDDLVLIAQTATFDFFTPPKTPTAVPSATASATAQPPEFVLQQPTKNITAKGYPSDDGFVVRAESTASAIQNESLNSGYANLRSKLINQGVLAAIEGDANRLKFTIDYAFSAPSAAASIIVGNNYSGNKNWKTGSGQTLGDYLDSITTEEKQA